MKCLGVFLAAYGTCLTLAEPGGEELEVPPLQLLQTKLDLQRARPNLLFLVLDQWRFDWDGSDGSDGPPLPTIDALGKSGVRFSRAYTPSPMCVPARSALAAVREYKDMWIKNNSNSYTRPQMTPTFMSVLRSVGYTTMLVGKDHLSDGAENLAGAQQAVDMDALGVDWFIRAVDKYAFCYGYGEPVDAYSAYLKEHELLQKQCEAYGNFALGESCGKTQVCDSTSIIECGFRCPKVNSVDHNHSVDTWVRRKAEELLQRHRETFGLEKPWFLQVNFLGPHPPLVPDELWQGSVRLPEAIDVNFTEILVFDLEGKKRYRPHPFKDLVNVTETRQIYAQHLLRIDREIKSILQTLERYEMRNTVIVVTGDHGDHLGDLGHFAKTSPWESSVHVPLLVTGPSLRKNVVVDHPVSLIDVPMTFLDLAKAKARETMQGHSLMPALTGTAPASTGSTARPAVMFGLNYIEEFTYDVDGAVVSLGRKQFDASAAIFGSDFLKLICCPSGCRKQGGLLPDVSMVTAQVALMNVTSRREDSFEYNILKPGSHAHGAEALYLAKFLAKDFQDVCVPLLLEYGNGA